MVDLALRGATVGDVDELARLWHAGWQDAHAAILPSELKQLRTIDSFGERLGEGLSNVRVAQQGADLAGFVMLKGDEVYQFYVAAWARGTGVASTLMADALEQLSAAGVSTAWLACAIGNDRAGRFYEKLGWHRTGVMTSRLPTAAGIFEIDVWRYEIDLTTRF